MEARNYANATKWSTSAAFAAVIYYPWSIQNALDNRIVLGEAAVLEYWTEFMSKRQRNAVDLWIIRRRPDLLKRCAQCPQLFRFVHVIGVLYEEYTKEKAAAEAAGKGTQDMH